MRLQQSAGNQAVATVLAPQARERPADGERQAGSALVQRLVAPGSFAPPTPPGGPAAEHHPGFRAMKSRTKHTATKLRSHPSAATETHRAQQAAVPPTNDAASQAKAAAVEDMSSAKPGVFDKAAFMVAVRAAIEKAAPKDNKEADEFKSTGKADQVKQQVKGQVAAGKDSSAADIKGKAEAPPDPSKAQVKPVAAMEPTKQPDTPPDPGAAAAMPARAPPGQTDLNGAPNEVNAKMADAHVSEQTLANSNEPQFQDALAAKKTGEAHSAAAPVAVRAQEQQVLSGAQAGASSAAKGALGAMLAAKVGANGAVGQKKSGAKSADEAARAQVASQIETIYQHTKTDADTILKDLDGKVDTTFEKGEAEAKAAFEEFHSSRVTDWKVKRYLLPVGGLIQWGIDQFKPLNPELVKIFSDARAVYMQKMDAVISNVADLIGTELTRARTRIAQGRQEVKDFVAKQKGDLAKVAKDAESSITGKFDDLDKSVDDKQAGMVDDLAEKYVDARKGIDERITALQDENKGLWEQAKGAVAGAIDTILKLKDMLLGVLARAQGAVEKIIEDPMKFLGNLISGVRSGLDRFVANIAGHLKKGLMGWLFGELSNAGIELPEKFDLKGIFNLVASILGLSWANFRTRLVAKVGEKTAGRIEQGLDFVKAIASGGLGGAWEFIVTKIGNLKDMVMDQVKEFVITKVVMAGVQWLIGLLNPAAAFVKACKMIYDVIMWFVDNGQRIKEFVDSVLDSVESIVAGNIGKVATMIEDSLAKILPLAIGFLASLLGLGGLGEKIKKILLTVQKPVNKVFDFLIGKAVKWGKGILSKLKSSKIGKAAAKVKAKAKAAYAKGKAFVKKKVTAAKKWVKGKVDSAKAKIKAILNVNESFGEAEGRHTVSNNSGSNELVMHSNPITLRYHSHPPIRALAKAYKKLLDSGSANAKAAAKSILSSLMKTLAKYEASHTGPGKSAPSIGIVAAHNAGTPRHRDSKWKEWSLESEHVVPRDLISNQFALRGHVAALSDSEYNSMTTVMIYERAAKGKTNYFGGDNVGARRIRNMLGGKDKLDKAHQGKSLRGRDEEARQAQFERVKTGMEVSLARCVTRTVGSAANEWSINGKRRGEAAPVPEQGKVQDAARKQIDFAIELLRQRLKV